MDRNDAALMTSMLPSNGASCDLTRVTIEAYLAHIAIELGATERDGHPEHACGGITVELPFK